MAWRIRVRIVVGPTRLQRNCRAQFAEPQVTVHDEVATLLKEIIANPAAKSDPKLYDELKKRKLVKPYEYTVFT